MTSLHLTVGIPASGKSTFARAWAAEDPDHRFRVNRDDIRAFQGLRSGQNEPLVTKIQHSMIRMALKDGIDVVVDDTNLVPKFAKELLKIAAEFGAEVIWHEEFLDVDVRVCIDRDRNREASVGQDVIMRMYERSKQWKRPTLSEAPDLLIFKPYSGTPGKPKTFLVDIDGTVASNGESRDNPNRGWFDWHRVEEDLPIKVIIDIVNHFIEAGLRPIFVSGRDEVCRNETQRWIKQHVFGVKNSDLLHESVPLFKLFMRPEGDNRKDSLVKLEIFDQFIRDNYDVQFAVDDRDQVVKAYREVLGLTVLQVADGNF